MFTQNELASHDARAITLLVLGVFVLGMTLGGVLFHLLFRPDPGYRVHGELRERCQKCGSVTVLTVETAEGDWPVCVSGFGPLESCPFCNDEHPAAERPER